MSSNQRLVECIGYIQEADFQPFAIVSPRSLKRIRQGQNKDLSNRFIFLYGLSTSWSISYFTFNTWLSAIDCVEVG